MELYCRATAHKKPTDDRNTTRHDVTLANHPLAERILAEAAIEHPDECFWASNALFAVGGDTWKAWQANHEGLEALRIKDFESEHYGSWHPVDGLGRIETTAFRILALQAFYRYSALNR